MQSAQLTMEENGFKDQKSEKIAFLSNPLRHSVVGIVELFSDTNIVVCWNIFLCFILALMEIQFTLFIMLIILMIDLCSLSCSFCTLKLLLVN